MIRKKILITSVGGDVACAVLRCLREEKEYYEIIGCDINEDVQGKMYIDQFLISPRYANRDEYCSFIDRTCKEYGIDIFLPIGEPEIIIAAERRDVFEEQGIKIVIAGDEVIRIATDKYRTYEACQKWGLPVPPTVTITQAREQKKIPFDFPAVLKRMSGCGAKGMRRITNQKELEEVFADMTVDTAYIIQKEIGTPDEEYTMGVFSDGENVSSLAFKRKLGFGSMSIRVETVQDDQLEETALKMAKAFHLCGSINVQMRKENDTYYIFEINPRLSSSCAFRHLNGFKDAVWWIRLLDNRNPEISFRPVPGRVGIKILDELMLS